MKFVVQLVVMFMCICWMSAVPIRQESAFVAKEQVANSPTSQTTQHQNVMTSNSQDDRMQSSVPTTYQNSRSLLNTTPQLPHSRSTITTTPALLTSRGAVRKYVLRRNLPSQRSRRKIGKRELESTCTGDLTATWQVGLLIETTNHEERRCGGVLIHKHWVLTAAHCVENSTSIWTIIGSTQYWGGFLGKQGQKTTVNDTIIHELYKPTDGDTRAPKHDIALLRLSEDAVFDRDVAIAQLPPRNSSLATSGSSMIISGWGRSRKNPFFRERLRCARVPVVSHEDCVASYKLEKVHIQRSQICTKHLSSGEGPCNGDSGGGLIHRGSDGQNTVVGIISWSKNCEHYTVYTNVRKHRPWLLRNAPEVESGI